MSMRGMMPSQLEEDLLHLKAEEDIQARVTAEVARKMKGLNLGKSNEAKVFCILCENEEHETNHCPEVTAVKEMIKEEQHGDGKLGFQPRERYKF